MFSVEVLFNCPTVRLQRPYWQDQSLKLTRVPGKQRPEFHESWVFVVAVHSHVYVRWDHWHCDSSWVTPPHPMRDIQHPQRSVICCIICLPTCQWMYDLNMSYKSNFVGEFAGKKNGSQMEHPEQAAAFTVTVRSHCLGNQAPKKTWTPPGHSGRHLMPWARERNGTKACQGKVGFKSGMELHVVQVGLHMFFCSHIFLGCGVLRDLPCLPQIRDPVRCDWKRARPIVCFHANASFPHCR